VPPRLIAVQREDCMSRIDLARFFKFERAAIERKMHFGISARGNAGLRLDGEFVAGADTCDELLGAAPRRDMRAIGRIADELSVIDKEF